MDTLCLLALDSYLRAIIAPCVVVLPRAEVQEGGRRVGGFAGAFVAATRGGSELSGRQEALSAAFTPPRGAH